GGEPVGGTPGGSGGEPVGGGGSGGEPVGGTPDAALPDPDAAIVTPDAAVVTPDAAVLTPDAAVLTPDAAVIIPDAAVIIPDAALPDPDAAPPEPDAAPAPVYACGIVPVEDLDAAFVATDANHWTLVGEVLPGGSEMTGLCGGGGPEKVYGFTVPSDGVWRFDTIGVETDFDTVLYLLDSCPTQADGQNLRCSDDVASLASGLLKELDAGDVVYVVVDDWANTGGTFRLNAAVLPAVGEREVCDAFSETDACADGLFCYALNRPGEPIAEQGLCVPSTNPPRINSVTALRLPDDVVGLNIDGSDSEADATGLYLIELLAGNRAQVLDQATGQTELQLDAFDNPLGSENFVIGERLAIFANWPQTTAVRVRLLDSSGNVSPSATAQIAPVPVLNAGQLCDIRRLSNVCPEGQLCIDADGPEGAGRAVCAAPTAPTLDTVTVTSNPATATISLTYSGSDPDRDIEALAIVFLDRNGDVIDPPGQQVFTFDSIDWNGAAFTAHVRLRLGAESASTVALATAVYDPLAGSGVVVVEEFGEPAVVGRNERCDLFFGGRDVCAAGNLCYSADFGAIDGTCQAPVAACPDFWPVADLTDFPVGAEWRFDGSLADAVNRTTASCARMSAQDFYTFTAPQAGTYRFRTDSAEPGADTALVLRSFCRYNDFGAELACSDDVSPQNYLSDVSVDLAAGETVYVLVGGVLNAAFPKGSFRGRYRLIATRR
ncbi:hypothetical protein L6V77_33935, partial [Myxococcota bacterium]|nr:hypothetical protein [Myxococcota bacterium]